MGKQVIEIKVPEGKIAVWEEGKVIFKDKELHWKSLRSFEDCLTYLRENDLCVELRNEFDCAPKDSYSKTICKYRIVVAALTNNEKRHLTTGERWIPTIEFCESGYLENCNGNEVVGKIESEGKEYLVIGSGVNICASAGLGDFDSNYSVSNYWVRIGFQSVSSKEIAEHISTYFGRLLFEIQYGGCNCNWEWID